MKITIDTHNSSREEVKALLEYLNCQHWDFKTDKINEDSFIRQTADDYAMSYSDVEDIYNKWSQHGMFYRKLEEFLKKRSK